jgi:hypothetical protein
MKSWQNSFANFYSRHIFATSSVTGIINKDTAREAHLCHNTAELLVHDAVYYLSGHEYRSCRVRIDFGFL